jgi:hypothetical protein
MVAAAAAVVRHSRILRSMAMAGMDQGLIPSIIRASPRRNATVGGDPQQLIVHVVKAVAGSCRRHSRRRLRSSSGSGSMMMMMMMMMMMLLLLMMMIKMIARHRR